MPPRSIDVESRSSSMNPYVVFLLYLIAILGFVAVTLLMNRYLGPKPIASAIKLEPFECGATPIETRNVKAVPIKYYAVAIAFMLFDLETVFLYHLGARRAAAHRLHACSRSSSSPVLLVADPAVRVQGAAAGSGDGIAHDRDHDSDSSGQSRHRRRSSTSRPRRTSSSAGRASSRCFRTRSSPPAARWSSWR